MDVAPFTHTADVDKIFSQQIFILPVGQLMCWVGQTPITGVGCTPSRLGRLGSDPHTSRFPTPGIAQPFPELQITDKLAFLIVKLGMRLVGLGLFVHRPIAHVLHAEGTGNDQHLVQRTAVLGLQNHAANAWVQRQLGQRAANCREFVVVVHRPKLRQQLVAIGHRPALRRLDEGEVFNRAQVQRLHAQDHRSQRTAQDLRIGKALASAEILLVVQTYTDTVRNPATAPSTLVGGGLADRLDQQLLDLVAKAIALDTRRASVNHVTYAGHGQRGFSHVGGQHNAATRVAGKNLVLLGWAQAGKQRQHFGVAVQRLV